MSALIGRGQIKTLTGGTLAITTLSGYVSPNLQTLRLVHAGDKKTSKGQAGEVTAAYYSDESLEITVDFIPEGTTIANAKLAAGCPSPGATVTLSGFPIFVKGAFTDALNGDWIYEGSDDSLPNDDKMTSSMKLWKTKGITSTAAITS